MTVSKKPATRAIAIVANDKVLDWLLPFLESYRDTNAEIPLHLIPFDDNISRTRRAADGTFAAAAQTCISDRTSAHGCRSNAAD